MNNNRKSTMLVVGILGVGGCALYQAAGRCQEPVEASLGSSWMNDVWGIVHMDTPSTTRVKRVVNVPPYETVLGNKENGRIAYAFNLASSTETNTSWRESRLMLHDLSDENPMGYFTQLFKINIEKPDENVDSPNNSFTSPLFAPNGRDILWRFVSEDGSYFLGVLNSKSGKLQPVEISEDDETTGLTSEVIRWSPDSQKIAYFSPARSDTFMPLEPLDVVDTRRGIYIRDLKTSQRKLIAKVQGATNIQWLDSHIVSYSGLPESKVPFDAYRSKRLPVSNIYSYDTDTNKSRLLIKDGVNPEFSPNGRSVVFFGGKDAAHTRDLMRGELYNLWLWRFKSQGSSLCVSNIDGTNRVAISPYYDVYPRVKWLHKRNGFVILEKTVDKGQINCKVRKYDVDHKLFKNICTLRPNSLQLPKTDQHYSLIEFPYMPLEISEDDRYLYVKCISRKKLVGGKNEVEVETLKRVDLTTGQIVTVAALEGLYLRLEAHKQCKPEFGLPAIMYTAR